MKRLRSNGRTGAGELHRLRTEAGGERETTGYDPFDIDATGCECGSPPHLSYRSGFRAQGAGFRVQGLEFRVQGSGFRVQGSEFKYQGSGFGVQGSGFRVQGSGFKYQGSGFRVQSLGFGGSGLRM